jgi:hypothetical protein
MSLNIIDFVKKLLPSVDKNDVESDLEISQQSLDDLLSIYADLTAFIDKVGISSSKTKKTINEIYHELERAKPSIKLGNKKNIATDLIRLLTNAKENSNTLAERLQKDISEVTVTGSLEAYKANLLSAAAHYRFLTQYATDLANYIYTNEQEDLNKSSSDSLLNPAQVKYIENKAWIFGKIIAGYGQPSDVFTEKLDNIAQVNINKEENEAIEDRYGVNSHVELVDGLPRGFIGSPIYTIRLVFAQWEADRYREMKDKKKLLELRYYYLSAMKDRGEADLDIEKEIEYLQKRITKLDYKMSKIEESVDD